MSAAAARVGAALACLVLLVTTPAGADEAKPDDLISVLAFNVHGLFPLAAKDNPRDRMPTIGWLAKRYDVVLFQEDYEYHDLLRQQMDGRVGIRGNGMGFDPRRVGMKILLAPVSIFLPHFSPPYGAGISIFLKKELRVPGEVDREPYGVCFGWFGAHGDCWSAKGYLRVGIQAANGQMIDVYNTHLEAGSTDRSTEVRGQQLEILADAIENRSRDRALILGGDLNMAFDRPGDRALLAEFRKRLDLKDSGAGPELPFWRVRDHILYRSSATTGLQVEKMGEAQEFVSGSKALSDHPGIYARFRVTARSVQAGATP